MQKIPLLSLAEERLIARDDIRQFGRDIRDFHLRADGPRQAVGSAVMAPVVAVSKFGNALVGQLSSEPAVPLGEGALKYTMRDVRSAAGNVLAAGKNLITLHPIRAAGNVLKAGFDGFDLVTDPFLDLGSNIFGQQQRKTRSAFQKTLAA